MWFQHDLDFNIAFATPANFTELTEGRNIVSYSSTTISLIHVSGGNGVTDTLVFTKNLVCFIRLIMMKTISFQKTRWFFFISSTTEVRNQILKFAFH